MYFVELQEIWNGYAYRTNVCLWTYICISLIENAKKNPKRYRKKRKRVGVR